MLVGWLSSLAATQENYKNLANLQAIFAIIFEKLGNTRVTARILLEQIRLFFAYFFR